MTSHCVVVSHAGRIRSPVVHYHSITHKNYVHRNVVSVEQDAQNDSIVYAIDVFSVSSIQHTENSVFGFIPALWGPLRTKLSSVAAYGNFHFGRNKKDIQFANRPPMISNVYITAINYFLIIEFRSLFALHCWRGRCRFIYIKSIDWQKFDDPRTSYNMIIADADNNNSNNKKLSKTDCYLDVIWWHGARIDRPQPINHILCIARFWRYTPDSHVLYIMLCRFCSIKLIFRYVVGRVCGGHFSRCAIATKKRSGDWWANRNVVVVDEQE